MDREPVIVKGAGDLATGVAHRLFQCGFPVLMLEISRPTAIRRTVSFAEAVYEGEYTVEGVTAVLANSDQEAEAAWQAGCVAVMVDPAWRAVQRRRPSAVVDAIMAKKNLGTSLADAPVTIGLGPGFTAGRDVRAVIETQRGHFLGKVIYSGSAAPNTGEPGIISGYSWERLLRSPNRGVFQGLKEIGDMLNEGDVVANVGSADIIAPVSGLLRGILRNGLPVAEGCKVGDIDPRGVREHCFTISDKARAIAGGVVEAILHCMHKGIIHG